MPDREPGINPKHCSYNKLVFWFTCGFSGLVVSSGGVVFSLSWVTSDAFSVASCGLLQLLKSFPVVCELLLIVPL